MTQKLAAADVARIAALARLDLSPAEIDTFSKQLGDILSYVEQIQQANTTGVAPMSHPLATGPVWRPDDPVASLDRDALIEQAPDGSRRAGLFKVPKVL